ncbi:RNA-directed DNA polymerase from mobile element jockey [Exaiptasia diaphana]|nr:RNA-directed DNA polymerase from mobile element jockey [Exaiptasia diaphana]
MHDRNDGFHPLPRSLEKSGSSCLLEFVPVSSESVEKIMKMSSSKSCSLDPIPACIINGCSSGLAGPISKIINVSLTTGSVPSVLKVAKVTPCLKKKTLDKEDLKNYRPISNLPYLSKCLERVVSCQLQQYLYANDLFSSMQSAYRQNFSTETALLRVQNDILMALDRGDEVLLILLDYSSAFDTIDHSTLLWRLENRFGVKGVALSWFRSYLEGRYQFVSVNGSNSPSLALKKGVPQGSVLGPLLFTLYISPIEDIILSRGIDCMFYADDSQLYVVISKGAQPSSKVTPLEQCLADIKAWTVENKLVLNDSKTDLLHLRSNFVKEPCIISELSVGDATIKPKSEVRNLGVMFDQHLNMKHHVSNICKNASYALYNIGKIRRYLDSSATERLVHAWVSSRLDSCNSLLYGLPKAVIDRLQHIQNSAARLVTKSKKSDHVTPLLKELHWLTIRKRIQFKICLFMFKIFKGAAPSYLSDLCTSYKPIRTLRSAYKFQYKVPVSRTITFGDRAFAIAGPKLWNSLPEELKRSQNVDIFKSKLKTYLFN